MAFLGPYLWIYQIHSATLESGVLHDPGVLAELEAVLARGIELGMAVTGPLQRETVEQASNSSVSRRSRRRGTARTVGGVALAAAHRAGVAVVVKEPLANG